MISRIAVAAVCATAASGVGASQPAAGSAFGATTVVAATQAADAGNCAKSMQIIAADLRDRRFALLPGAQRGAILTAWSRCAIQLGQGTRVTE